MVPEEVMDSVRDALTKAGNDRYATIDDRSIPEKSDSPTKTGSGSPRMIFGVQRDDEASQSYLHE